MKKQNDLQWFLIKKFIEILAVVGVVEYPVCSFNVTDLRSIECNASITAS